MLHNEFSLRAINETAFRTAGSPVSLRKNEAVHAIREMVSADTYRNIVDLMKDMDLEILDFGLSS